MRQWKLIYLVLASILFIVLLLPIFQNMMYPVQILFFWKYVRFVSLYMTVIPLSMLIWVLLTLYIKSLVSDITRQWATKFDLKD